MLEKRRCRWHAVVTACFILNLVSAYGDRYAGRSDMLLRRFNVFLRQAAFEPFQDLTPPNESIQGTGETNRTATKQLNSTEDYEIVGLQYTDAAYVGALLSVVIPAGALYLYFAFVGASKAAGGIFAAISAAVMLFYLSLAFLINMDTPALPGLALSTPILGAVFAASMFYPEQLGWSLNIFMSDLLAVSLVYNLTAALSPSGYGIISLAPNFDEMSDSRQFVLFFCSLLCLAACAFAIRFYLAEKHQLPPPASRSFVSAFVSAYGVIAMISYIGAISGLTTSSPFDPIAFWDQPTVVSFKAPNSVIPLACWCAITAWGFFFQQKRDVAS